MLGSERHESRRIDNQLRGRAGRQGDPGESRFYLSLEDELMRLFATGAMSWVMDRALPDDVPIEARMVTRAIERAQNTVEQKNAEVRKDVLKYDEVMNEQRKVIYERRMQVIDGEDLREHTARAARADMVDQVVANYCPSQLPRGVGPRAAGRRARAVLPDDVLRRRPRGRDRDPSSSSRASSPRRSSSTRSARRPSPAVPRLAREIERQIMLQIIDQRWRQHLVEMDYLREGIHLRGIAQTDPLVAWQREGFEMFGKLMDAIDDDYLRYVMHVAGDLVAGEDPGLRAGRLRRGGRPAAGLGEPGASPSSLRSRPAQPRRRRHGVAPTGHSPALDRRGESSRPAVPVLRTGGAGTPCGRMRPTATRTARPPPSSVATSPCWCGSGKKFKLCHGAS